LAQPAIINPARMTAANLAQRTMLTTFIPVPPLLPYVLLPGLAAPSLNERSVNLDAALQRSLDPEEPAESFGNG
jgi:hypothetical protein